MKNQDSLTQLTTLYESYHELFSKTSDTEADITRYGAWSLKDIIAHVNHWMEHDRNCLRLLRKNKIPYWHTDVDIFNAEGVRKRENFSWEEIVDEFNRLSGELMSEYRHLKSDEWEKKIWPNNTLTPEKTLTEDIVHLHEHLIEITKMNK